MTEFDTFCTLMIIGAFTKATKDMNNIPSPNSMCESLSPSSIIKDIPAPDYNVLSSLNYGDYIEVHNGN